VYGNAEPEAGSAAAVRYARDRVLRSIAPGPWTWAVPPDVSSAITAGQPLRTLG
jgi:hypothetical protein